MKAKAGTGRPSGLPNCECCGDAIALHDDATVMLRGMWMYSVECAAEVFVLDPETELLVQTLPNGQQALLVDKKVTRHAETDCVDLLVEEMKGADDDEEAA